MMSKPFEFDEIQSALAVVTRRCARARRLTVAELERSGGMGIRTPGLVIANDALYQLSYTPVPGERHYRDRTETGKQKGSRRKVCRVVVRRPKSAPATGSGSDGD